VQHTEEVRQASAGRERTRAQPAVIECWRGATTRVRAGQRLAHRGSEL